MGVSASPTILALEKRIAFDAAGAHVVAKLAKTAVADVRSGGQDPVTHHRFVPQADLARDVAQTRVSSLFGSPLLADLRAPVAKRDHSVVFIEADVPDLKDLVKSIDRNTRIVLLDPTKDGVDEITSYLTAHKGMKNVYIFSHGSEATLNLGTATLDSASMTGRYAGDLATIKGSLANNANILVYGCDFAKTAAGDSAAHLLSQLTGAAVAASTDNTGGTAEGGNFVLEDDVGTISARNVVRPSAAKDYVGLLAAPTTIFSNSGTGAYQGNLEFLTFANTSLASGGITNGATATYTTAEGSTVTVTFSNVSNATDAATFKPAALNAYFPVEILWRLQQLVLVQHPSLWPIQGHGVLQRDLLRQGQERQHVHAQHRLR